MEVKEKRHQIEEREQFTNSQKDAIAAKSSDRCVWCGKKVYFKYGATVDHYIPLKKGGTNDFVNLVMMCEACNEKKGSKVVPPNIGANYLNPEHRDKLFDHFDEYVEKFRYVSRGNLMACDMYELKLYSEELGFVYEKAYRKGKKKPPVKPLIATIQRAYPDDEDKIVEYYIKYLKKYDTLDSEEAARENIKFWMRFGAIYFVEKQGEIAVIQTLLVNKNGFLSMNLFPYYAKPLIRTITKGMMSAICEAIVREHNLKYLPFSANMLSNDSVANRILESYARYPIDNMWCVAYVYDNTKYVPTEDDIDGHENVKKFMQSFNDVENEATMYLYDNDLMGGFNWMLDEIVGREYINFSIDSIENTYKRYQEGEQQ